MEKSDTKDNIQKLETLDGLERICLIGPMIQSFTPNTKHQAFICVDGGAHLKPSLPQHLPCLTIGDGDSYDKSHDINYPAKKDFSDFALALKMLPSSVKSIDLYGLRNGRKDHEFINIGEMLSFLVDHTHLKIASFINNIEKDKDDTWYALNKGKHVLNFTGTYSIITLEKQNLKISGDSLYKGKDIALNALSSQGLSNEANGKITIECQKPLLLMRSNGD